MALNLMKCNRKFFKIIQTVFLCNIPRYTLSFKDCVSMLIVNKEWNLLVPTADINMA